MSTHIGPTFQQSQFVSGVPVDLLIQVGLNKQQKFDKNLENINSKYQQIASTKINKASDKEYIDNVLGDIRDTANSLTNLDISDNSNLRILEDNISKVASDDKFYKKIMANIADNKELDNLNFLKQTNSKAYNSINEQVFLNNRNTWLNDPNNDNYNAKYTNYYDIGEKQREIVKTLKPSVREVPNIVTYIDADGQQQQIQNGTKIISEVSPERIREALMGSMDNGMMEQLRINYQYKIQNSSEESMRDYYQSQVDFNSRKIDSIKESLSQMPLSVSPEYAQAEEMIKFLEEKNKDLNRVLNSGKSVKEFYTFENFFDNQINNIAGSNAYTDKIDINENDLLGKYVDFTFDAKLEEIKGQLAIEKERILKSEGLGSTYNKEGGATNSDGTPVEINDPFWNTISDVYFEGAATVDTKTALSLLTSNKPDEETGRVTIDVTDREQFFNVADVLNVPENKRKVVSEAQEKLNRYNEAKQKYNKGQELAREVTFGANNPIGRIIAKGINKAADYNYFEGSQAESDLLKSLGNFDPENNEYVSYLKSIGKEDTKDLISNMANIKGQVLITANEGKNNVFGTNEGNKIFVKTNAIVSAEQLKGSGYSEDDIERLKKKNLIYENTTIKHVNDDGTKSSQKMYSIPLNIASDKDMSDAHNIYYQNTESSSDFTKNQPARIEQFKRYNQAVILGSQVAKSYMSKSGDIYASIEGRLGQLLYDKDIDQTTYDSYKKEIEQLAQTVTSSSFDRSVRRKSAEVLQKLYSSDVKTLSQLIKGGVPNTGTGQVTKGSLPALDLSSIDSNIINKEPELVGGVNSYIVKQPTPTAHKFDNPIIEKLLYGIAKAEGGEYDVAYRGTKFTGFAKHPGKLVRQTINSGPNKGLSSDAAGKYQFLSKTFNELAERLKLKDFSPVSQDIAGYELLKEKMGSRNLEDDLAKGEFHYTTAFQATWEAFRTDNVANKHKIAEFVNTLADLGIKVIFYPPPKNSR